MPLARFGDLSGERFECGVYISFSVFSIWNLMPLNLSLFFGEDRDYGELISDLLTPDGDAFVCSELNLNLWEYVKDSL